MQIPKIDSGCGDNAILSLLEGQSYRKFLKFMSEVRMAPLLIFEEQDYRTFFRFDFRGESYLIPIFFKDRTIANVQQIFGGEDGAVLF